MSILTYISRIYYLKSIYYSQLKQTLVTNWISPYFSTITKELVISFNCSVHFHGKAILIDGEKKHIESLYRTIITQFTMLWRRIFAKRSLKWDKREKKKNNRSWQDERLNLVHFDHLIGLKWQQRPICIKNKNRHSICFDFQILSTLFFLSQF